MLGVCPQHRATKVAQNYKKECHDKGKYSHWWGTGRYMSKSNMITNTAQKCATIKCKDLWYCDCHIQNPTIFMHLWVARRVRILTSTDQISYDVWKKNRTPSRVSLSGKIRTCMHAKLLTICHNHCLFTAWAHTASVGRQSALTV